METVEDKKPPVADIPSKSRAELVQLAQDVFNDKVFCDWMIKNLNDVSSVFMLIPLGAFSEWTEEQQKDLGMVYEYIDQAGPRAVNGMPNFLSLKLINRSDFYIFRDLLAEIGKADTELTAKLMGDGCETEVSAPDTNTP